MKTERTMYCISFVTDTINRECNYIQLHNYTTEEERFLSYNNDFSSVKIFILEEYLNKSRKFFNIE